MTTRTFKQIGQGYGNSPVQVVAKINGAEVYNGEIPTLNQIVPSVLSISSATGVEIFTWTDTVDFAGAKSLEITVSNGTLLLASTVANYLIVGATTEPFVDIPAGPDFFSNFYRIKLLDGTWMSDPLTDVVINGIPQTVDRAEGLYGQWYWVVPSGSVLTATLNIQAGMDV